jgi:hypothetical protein
LPGHGIFVFSCQVTSQYCYNLGGSAFGGLSQK